MTNIERLLKEDSREKKKIGRGVFNRASRKGFIKGGVKTPYDYMNRYERNQLNSEEEVYNMYKEVIPYEDFKKLDDEDKARVYDEYRKRFTPADLAEKWGVKRQVIYDWKNKLKTKKTQKINKGVEPVSKEVITFKSITELHGKLTGKDLQNRLLNLGICEDHEYIVHIELEEVLPDNRKK